MGQEGLKISFQRKLEKLWKTAKRDPGSGGQHLCLPRTSTIIHSWGKQQTLGCDWQQAGRQGMIGERVRQTHGQILSPYDGRNCWVLYLLDSHYADEVLGENYHHKILTMDIISSAINNNGSGQASFVNLCLWSPGGRPHVILRLKARTWSQRVLNDLLKHRQVACDTLQHELPQGTEENVYLCFQGEEKAISESTVTMVYWMTMWGSVPSGDSYSPLFAWDISMGSWRQAQCIQILGWRDQSNYNWKFCF